MRYFSFALLFGCALAQASPSQPDWSSNLEVPPGGRPNPYALSAEEFAATVEKGRTHAVWYPVDVTGLLVPYRAFVNFLDASDNDPFKRFIKQIFRNISNFRNTDQVFKWLGLHDYPAPQETGVYQVPHPEGGSEKPNYRMGFTKVQRFGTTGFTFSCAACHSGNLFGKKVLGMTNRFSRANEFFIKGKQGAKFAEGHLFKYITKATPEELRLLEQVKSQANSVAVRSPQALGLDTSLAQVALSLAKRNDDAYATKSWWYEKFPRYEPLEKLASDSKPAVWWNLKYKNRWLSDGSIVAGNPVYTNFLWNEIGRGVDLYELEGWLKNNQDVVKEITTAVFASEAPRYTDFFPATNISLERAKHGERLFNQSCARCHGVYEKAWNQPNADRRSPEQLLATTLVRYLAKTPVRNVGTDPARYLGMDSLARGLNPLAISKNIGVWIEPQKGYVPPPLVGIWARWPYFHNNSVPSLCAVLTRQELRPKKYWAGEPWDKQRDFDSNCNGYPIGDATPDYWKQSRDFLFDTDGEGLSNRGHDEGIFLRKGQELLSNNEKMAIIEYLKTL